MAKRRECLCAGDFLWRQAGRDGLRDHEHEREPRRYASSQASWPPLSPRPGTGTDALLLFVAMFGMAAVLLAHPEPEGNTVRRAGGTEMTSRVDTPQTRCRAAFARADITPPVGHLPPHVGRRAPRPRHRRPPAARPRPRCGSNRWMARAINWSWGSITASSTVRRSTHPRADVASGADIAVG